jgi:hypothetical protein
LGEKKNLLWFKEKRVSEYCIKTALKAIDEADYQKTLMSKLKKSMNR